MFGRFFKYLVGLCEIFGTEDLLVETMVSNEPFAGVAFTCEWGIHVRIRCTVLIDFELLFQAEKNIKI